MPLKLDLNLIGAPVWIVDVVADDSFRIFGVNDVAAREYGLNRLEVAGRLFVDCLCAPHAAALTSSYRLCVRKKRIHEFEEEVEVNSRRRWFRTTLTPLIDDASGRVVRVMAFSQDITNTKQLQAELRRFAFQDSLTGLPNRRRFDQAIDNILAEAVYTNAGFSVAVVDLDSLKHINDNLGHAVGDEAIRHVGRLLTDLVEPDELVARVGGDEFYLLMRVRTVEDLDRRLDRIRAVVDQGLFVPGQDLTLSLSVGGAVCLPDMDLPDVIKAADAAMYAEKEIRRLVRLIDERRAA